MSLILAWVPFPLVLALLGLGWGFLAERAAGARVNDALLLPLGLATALVVAGTLAAFAVTAPAAIPVAALGAVAGLPLVWAGRKRLGRWPLIAAGAALLAYGAPILLSGQATFAGYVRLDDTSVWFNVVDHFTSGPHPAHDSSTYSLIYGTTVGPTYPRGAFVLPAVARGLTGVDIAWVFQPYLACCAAALAVCLYALAEPLVSSPRVRALVAFLAANSALLYGYGLWGGVKELTAAFLVALGVALAAAILRDRPKGPRQLLPLALAAGALIQTLGVGAAAWVAIAFACLAIAWLWGGWGQEGDEEKGAGGSAISLAWLAGLTAVFVVPVWIILSDFLSNDAGLFSSGQTEQTKLGNLTQALSPFQLSGLWPVGDFRSTPATLPAVLLIGAALALAAWALWESVRRRKLDLALYAAVALGACAVFYLVGATPWVTAKALTISSPALLLAALIGATMLWRRRRAGVIALALLAFAVLWTSALAYHDELLAPRARLAELQRIGELVTGKGPTLQNEYEIYADGHFLRSGEPTEPAEYRIASLALRDGTMLTKSAWADLDSFPLATIEGYRSIVTRRSPAESRPPSNYRLIWQGRYYDLWQRPATPSTRILEHIPYGDSTKLPFCGAAQNGPSKPECSVEAAWLPRCPQIHAFAARAARLHADLLAYQRAEPVVARADQTLWPGRWYHDPGAHTLTANDPGTLVSHIRVAGSQRYELWLGGSFARGFQVSVDGRSLGQVKDELSPIGGYVHVGDVPLSAGVHTITLTYPHADLTPGSGDNAFTMLSAIALVPTKPPSGLVRVAPQQAGRLCGRPLDWIEIVAKANEGPVDSG